MIGNIFAKILWFKLQNDKSNLINFDLYFAFKLANNTSKPSLQIGLLLISRIYILVLTRAFLTSYNDSLEISLFETFNDNILS